MYFYAYEVLCRDFNSSLFKISKEYQKLFYDHPPSDRTWAVGGNERLKNTVNSTYCMKLKMLDLVSKLFNDSNFEDVLIIACQHILETNLIMFEYLFNQGLKPQNTFLLGKCYSTNRETLGKFRKKGVYVHEGSLKFDSHKSFDDTYSVEVRDFLTQVMKKENLEKFQKVVLVDDGGYLIDLADSIIKDKSNIVGVEQTTSGYNKLKTKKINFPIINVARSKTKLNLESPFIAGVVVEKLKERLNELNLTPKNALIIGAGPVGKEILNLLGKDLDSKIYDVQEYLSDFAKIKLNKIIPDFDLIIGATGTKIFDEESFNNLKEGAILVSASSSDREFLAVELRKKVPKTNNCHNDFLINEIYLLNAGFPINFDGKKHSAKPKDIQLTRALIFSALCLALSNNYHKKLIDLDEGIQARLTLEFER